MQSHNIVQGTGEWFELRLKYPLTASNAQAIGNKGKGLETLVWEKMSEMYSSSDRQSITNKDLERGIELEPFARNIYSIVTGYKVEQTGFVTNEDISMVGGASPDGLMGDDGLCEIKCFDDKKHFRLIIELHENGTFEIESQYIWQMQMQLLFTGRKWCDFIAYNPNYKETILIQRVYANDEMQNAIREGLEIGEQLIKKIKNNYKQNGTQRKD